MLLIVLPGMLTMLITLLLNIYHLDLLTNKRKKIYDLRHYFWDDPHLYKEGVDGVIRRCVPEHEQEQILQKCDSKAYAGHHAEGLSLWRYQIMPKVLT